MGFEVLMTFKSKDGALTGAFFAGAFLGAAFLGAAFFGAAFFAGAFFLATAFFAAGFFVFFVSAMLPPKRFNQMTSLR
tara:strand:- start:754 stop:987 length:234 start_codon:yes stop_codon:yes gene_type:complete